MPEVMMLLADLAIALGVAPINQFPGCWEIDVDDWRLAINAHDTPTDGLGAKVPPYSCYAMYKGWPAGIIDPHGGCMAAGKEDDLIRALKARINEPASR